MERFIETKPSEANISNIMKKLANKIQASGTWSTHGSLELLEALKASKIPDSHKQGLCQLAEEKIVGSDSGTPMALQKKQQSLAAPWNYMSGREWAALQNLTMHEMISLGIQRLKKIGVKSMKEDPTKKYLCVMVLHLYMKGGKQLPRPHQILNLVETIAQVFDHERQEALWPGVTQYPINPFDLGDDFIKAAYGEDLPEVKEVPGMATLAASVPLRNT